MCIFGGTTYVRVEVSGTNIFARRTSDQGQIIVYSMNIRLSSDIAMILPIPVALGSSEDAVRFINLEGYPNFFADMQQGFSDTVLARSAGSIMSRSLRVELPVHSVGRFEASYVPSVSDWDRLDERFRLPQNVWADLPDYHDYGFAVFKLKPTSGLFKFWNRNQTIHPMAFEFPSAMPNELFFPTVHVHDGRFHDEAEFDHSLFLQDNSGEENELQPEGKTHSWRQRIEREKHWSGSEDWRQSWTDADGFMKMETCGDTVIPSIPVYRRVLKGMLQNQDVLVSFPSRPSNRRFGISQIS